MASPVAAEPIANGISTPPNAASGTATAPAANVQNSPAATQNPTPATTGDASAAAGSGRAPVASDPSPTAQYAQPATSLQDRGDTKRPRDARLMHLVLANLGVTAYQERVPLQLLDFAYRYTSGVLADAVAITADGYGPQGPSASGQRTAANTEGSVSLAALRVAIASRVGYQFNAALPKEYMHELAQEKNRTQIRVDHREYGLRLPPERYCFMGTGWGVREEWESEGSGDEDGGQRGGGGRDEVMRDIGEDDDQFEDALSGDREMVDA